MTRQQIEALTQADVEVAKARAAVARKTREGLSTVDYILSDVGGPKRSLEAAKKYLIAKYDAR